MQPMVYNVLTVLLIKVYLSIFNDVLDYNSIITSGSVKSCENRLMEIKDWLFLDIKVTKC